MNIMLMNDYKLDQEKQKNVTCFDRDGFILGIILSDISFLNYCRFPYEFNNTFETFRNM